MNNFDWTSFLREESKKAIAEYKKEKSKVPKDSWTDNIVLSPSAIESEWLGFSGASETQIVAAENRLGASLPPSYREFLKVTNGWNDQYPGLPVLRPVEKINWFCVENQEWIDEWVYTEKHSSYSSTIPDEEYLIYDFKSSPWVWGQQPLRTEYMQTALQISNDDDAHVVLLNPKIIHHSEWEAWILMGGDGDVKRYRSFREMVQTLGLVNSWV